MYKFFEKTRKRGWMSLGGILLCITGSETMFADLGHFSQLSIKVAFTLVVYPSLILAYMGQAAYLSQHHVGDYRIGFYVSVPEILRWPVLAIAILAAVVGSQAVITGTFSIIKQCSSLGFFPRVKIVNTSSTFHGQIYIPDINWVLMLLCLAVTMGFRDTKHIGNASVWFDSLGTHAKRVIVQCLEDWFNPKFRQYGSHVGSTLRTGHHHGHVGYHLLMSLVIIICWGRSILFAICFIFFFGTIEAPLLFCCRHQISEGAWVPVALSFLFMFIMCVWHYGTIKKYEFDVQNKVSIKWLLDLGPSLGIVRVRGIGLIHTDLVSGIPAIFSHFVTNIPAFHQVLVFLCIKSVPIPHVKLEERFMVGRIGLRT
ncbi:hypothetical protein HPP92_018662 [Vanilla planifolia]|uniref:Uncharacterized protein n=1 Tax=Vanilla planifolia TaxID=51239 RepID=A0A835QGT5_VANPL|nr:hypothetical protein HPP92_018662 [Vanilla planifolia]